MKHPQPPDLDWAALLGEPTLIATLAPELQDEVYRTLVVAEAVARAVILTRRPPPPLTPADDQVVRIREAAHKLGMTLDYAHTHWRQLGGYKDSDGHIKFTIRTLTRHIKAREQGR